MVTPINRYQIPTAAESVNTLAGAMNYVKPSAEARHMADEYPGSAQEGVTVAKLYGAVKGIKVRQALLDVMVSIAENQARDDA